MDKVTCRSLPACWLGVAADNLEPAAEMNMLECLFTNQISAWHGLPWQRSHARAKIKEEAGKGDIPRVLGWSHWFNSMYHYCAAGVVASTTTVAHCTLVGKSSTMRDWKRLLSIERFLEG